MIVASTGSPGREMREPVDVDKRASRVVPAGKVCAHRGEEKKMTPAQMKRPRIVARHLKPQLTVIGEYTSGLERGVRNLRSSRHNTRMMVSTVEQHWADA